MFLDLPIYGIQSGCLDLEQKLPWTRTLDLVVSKGKICLTAGDEESFVL